MPAQRDGPAAVAHAPIPAATTTIVAAAETHATQRQGRRAKTALVHVRTRKPLSTLRAIAEPAEKSAREKRRIAVTTTASTSITTTTIAARAAIRAHFPRRANLALVSVCTRTASVEASASTPRPTPTIADRFALSAQITILV